MSNLESNIFITFVIVSCIILPITDAFQVGKIKAVYNSAHDNKFHNDNAIGIYLAKSTTSCFVECAKDLRCISFFFNSLTKSCILQADPFVYTVMTKSGTGWKFYLTQDRTGRCSDEFLYYRKLDLCYQFQPSVDNNGPNISGSCRKLGVELIRITSEERHKYVELVTADIGLVYNHPICIQGTITVHPLNLWTFEDGTLMTYFNWYYRNQRNVAGVIGMVRIFGYEWTVKENRTCTFICERR